MIILLNLISLNNNIAQSDDRAVRRPRGATTARHDRAGWTGKNLILDEALAGSQSCLYPHMRAKFGRDPTATSKKVAFNFISR